MRDEAKTKEQLISELEDITGRDRIGVEYDSESLSGAKPKGR